MINVSMFPNSPVKHMKVLWKAYVMCLLLNLNVFLFSKILFLDATASLEVGMSVSEWVTVLKLEPKHIGKLVIISDCEFW